MIVPRYYENLSVLHENTMPARAYSYTYGSTSVPFFVIVSFSAYFV